jgi:predicted kinase
MTEEEREVAFRKARRYFRLGRGYVIRSKLPPSLLILSGLMGTGKSTVASLLSFELGVPVLRSDVVRKRLAGLDAKEPRREAFGRGIYSEHFNVMTYRSLLASAEEVLSSGGSVIVDASFQKEEDRAAFRRLAEKEGARFYILQTVCPDAVVRKRLEERESNPAEVSDGRLEIFDQHKDSFEIPRESEGVIITIDTSLSPEASIDSLLRDMKLLP